MTIATASINTFWRVNLQWHAAIRFTSLLCCYEVSIRLSTVVVLVLFVPTTKFSMLRILAFALQHRTSSGDNTTGSAPFCLIRRNAIIFHPYHPKTGLP
ncbi:hypothetical protein Plhal304r1_c057g0143481 [Plasmopara halstedii]